MEFALTAMTDSNDYRGYKAILYNQLSNSVFERILNENGLPPEIAKKIIVPTQFRNGRWGSLLRRHYYSLFVEMCNRWRKEEMDKLNLPSEIQEDMFETRWNR